MAQVSPAVVGDGQVEKSGWAKTQSPISAIHKEICTESNIHHNKGSFIGEALSTAISAATVTLLDEEHMSESPVTAKQEVVDVVKQQSADIKAESAFGQKCDLEHQSKKIKMEKILDEVPRAKEVVVPMGGAECAERPMSPITVKLEGQDLWQQFFHAGTEMIITKTGRRMFPGIVVSVEGLDPDCKYNISLEVNLADEHRFKFVNAKWVIVGKAESHDEDMLVFNHPESPASGKHWMKNKVSFKKIKLSNNRNNKKGLVVALNSMHKYLPRVIISKFISKKKSIVVHTHDLEECVFVAVTAYQNDQVTQLKIDYNPFAKAFRDNSGEQEMFGGYANQQGGMMGAWPPLSPLLSPYGASYSGDYGASQALLSPAGIQQSPLPQFNTAFGTFTDSPPFSPSYRNPAHSSVLQQQLFGVSQPKPSPLPRFNAVFNTWDTPPQNGTGASASALPLAQHPQSAFMVPRVEPNSSNSTLPP